MAASHIEALIYEGDIWRWNEGSALGTPATVSYGFMGAKPGYYTGIDPAISNFQAFSIGQADAARAVLAQYAGIAKLTFTDIVPDVFVGEEETIPGIAQMLFGRSTQAGSAGYAYAPGTGDDTASQFNVGGDVWIATNSAGNADVTAGTYGYLTLVHEIGHALGLKHPFGASPALDGAHDTTRYTVMSYSEQSNNLFMNVLNPGTVDEDLDYYSVFADGPMLYDIAAMQYLYGANMTTRAGADSYTYDPDEPFFRCIWDAGGNDTIDVSNFSRGCEVDLRAGEFSNIAVVSDAIPPLWTATEPTYDGKDNLSIAFGVTLENAFGGTGADTLTGNSAGNALKGNGGADRLAGGLGKDTLTGGNGADRFAFASKPAAANADTVKDFSHADADRIALENNFFAIGGSLTSDELRVGTNISATGGAKTLAQKILYDSDSGQLYYDSDGSAKAHAPESVATLAGHPKLVLGDFIVT